MFMASTLAILNALQFSTSPVSTLEIPAGDLGSFSLQGARGPAGACSVALRTDPGSVRIRAAHRTSSKQIYSIYMPEYGEQLESEKLLPIEIIPPGWASSEQLVSIAGETTIMLLVSEFDSDKATQDVGVFAKNHFVQFITCMPSTCSCEIAK